MFKKSALIILIAFSLSGCMETVSSTATDTDLKSKINAANYNVQLGMGYLQQGDVQRAKRKLVIALQQAPDWAPAQEAMGYFMLSTGQVKQAEKYYHAAININPKSGSSQNNYGVYLCRTGQYKEADKHFMIAVQDPSYVNTADAYENAGLCAMQIPDFAKANSYFQNAIEQDPKRATSLLELSQIAYQQNNLISAKQYFDRYVVLTPQLGPDGLWLGIRIARKAHDLALADHYTLLLQNTYPNSNEYKQLLASRKKLALKA